MGTRAGRSGRPPVSAGEVLNGKYRVDRVLGVGDTGVVIAAEHLYLKHPVALKFMDPEDARDPAQVARFVREARALSKLTSEHVARVLDVDLLENGDPYLVMEHLDGKDLARVIRASPLPVPIAVDYLVQACKAIAEAHTLGIV